MKYRRLRQISLIPDQDDKSNIVTVVICNLIDGKDKVNFRCSLSSLSDIVENNLKV